MSREYDPHPLRSLAVLGYTSLSYSLAQTAVLPALPYMIRGLHTNANDIAWTLTAFFLSTAVFTPTLGRLGDMFGKRRMLLVAMAAFAAGAVISALATQLWVVAAGRALQGLGGAVIPLCFGIARDLFPPRHVARSIGFLSATIGFGGTIGLTASGVLVDHLSWHWIFWMCALLGALAVVVARVLLLESPIRTGGRVDVRGAVVLGVGLALPLLAISRAISWGWGDARTLGLTAAGIAILTAWVYIELHTEEPLADITSLLSRPVLATNLAAFFSGFGSLAIFILIPQLVEAPPSTGYGLGLDATSAGLILVPGSILLIVLSPVAASMGARVGDRVPLALGGIVSAGAMLVLAFVHGGQVEIVVFVSLAFGVLGLLFAAMPNLIVAAVPPTQTGEAAAFNFVVQRIGSALGGQLTAAILASSAVAPGLLPSDRGYTNAFLLGSGTIFVAGAAAFLIPRTARRGGRRQVATPEALE